MNKINHMMAKIQLKKANHAEINRHMFARMHRHGFSGNGALIQGKGKKPAELYDLNSDIGEQNNVAKANQAVALEMQAMLRKLIDAKDGIRKSGG